MDKLSFSTKFYRADDSVIYLRITAGRKKAEISTRRKIEVKKWDAAAQKSKGNNELNSYLVTILSQVNRIQNNLIAEDREVSAKLIKDIFLGRDEKSVLLLQYFDDHIREIAQLTNQYRPTTIKRYETIRAHLKGFLKERNIEDIKLNKWELKYVAEFDHYLKVKKGISTNTAAKYLKLFKALFLKAQRMDVITKNPFANFVFKTEETNKEFLTKDELRRFEDLSLSSPSLEKVRDAFLFSVYTGLRFSDAFALRPNDVLKESDGKYWLTKRIIKTDRPYRAPLLKRSVEIIEKYKEESKRTGKLLPLISNQKTNTYLKVLADLAGINKNITHHCARHTFATVITLSNNVPIEAVSSMLGHRNLKSTQIYAKVTSAYLSDLTTTLDGKLENA
jgi:site-specific recombinase XerD